MRLAWYILRLHAGPLVFGTCAVVFIFLLRFVFDVLSDLIGKGIGYDVIVKLIVYNLAWMIVLAAPIGVLIATLMAYGRLGGNNELVAMKSAGASAIRAMAPAVIGGLVLSVALFVYNDTVLPEANHRAYALRSDIKQLRPTFAVDPGRFSTIQDYSILARRVDRDRDELLDVTIYHRESDGDRMTVMSAKRARMEFTTDFSRLVMSLSNGEVQQVSRRDPEFFRRLEFGSYRLTIPTSGYRFEQSDPGSTSRGDRMLDVAALRAIADSAAASSRRAGHAFDALLDSVTASLVDDTDRGPSAAAALARFTILQAGLASVSEMRASELRRANQYMVEIHKKRSIPAACLVFVFVGAPLGILVRRGNFGVSATIALGFYMLYYFFLATGEKLADRLLLSPWLAMWLANIVLSALGAFLTVLVSRETVAWRSGG